MNNINLSLIKEQYSPRMKSKYSNIVVYWNEEAYKKHYLILKYIRGICRHKGMKYMCINDDRTYINVSEDTLVITIPELLESVRGIQSNHIDIKCIDLSIGYMSALDIIFDIREYRTNIVERLIKLAIFLEHNFYPKYSDSSIDMIKKVRIITHSDLDGKISGYLFREYLSRLNTHIHLDIIDNPNDTYNTLMKNTNFDFIFILDLSIKEEEYKKLPEDVLQKLIIIDHHVSSSYLNNTDGYSISISTLNELPIFTESIKAKNGQVSATALIYLLCVYINDTFNVNEKYTLQNFVSIVNLWDTGVTINEKYKPENTDNNSKDTYMTNIIDITDYLHVICSDKNMLFNQFYKYLEYEDGLNLSEMKNLFIYSDYVKEKQEDINKIYDKAFVYTLDTHLPIIIRDDGTEKMEKKKISIIENIPRKLCTDFIKRTMCTDNTDIGFATTDDDTVSIRVNDDCNFNASEFAKKFGGGGHKKAAGYPKTNNMFPYSLEKNIFSNDKNDLKDLIDSNIQVENPSVLIITPRICKSSDIKILNLIQFKLLGEQIEDYIKANNKSENISVTRLIHDNVHDTINSTKDDMNTLFNSVKMGNEDLVIFLNMNINQNTLNHYISDHLSDNFKEKNVIFINTDNNMTFIKNEDWGFSMSIEELLDVLSGIHTNIDGEFYRNLMDENNGVDPTIIACEQYVESKLKKSANKENN